MKASVTRTPKSDRQSPFFRDLATPFSAHRSRDGAGAGRFATPGQAAAVSALWRENFGAPDPPPPPVFTLDDRVDFSPEPGLADVVPPSPDSGTPSPPRGYLSSYSPLKPREEAGGSGAVVDGGPLPQILQPQSAGTSSWWSPAKSGDRDEKGKGSPVDGVVNPGALIILPPPREVARPEIQRNSFPVGGALDEEEWVTVFGYSPGDTNLVLREFEKCGVILKHIIGPRNANWMHILYQSRFDSQKALAKHGTQLNSVLIIGVKPVDAQQRQYLNESLESYHSTGYMVPLASEPAARQSSAALVPLGRSPYPRHKHNGITKTIANGRPPIGSIASPKRSVVSKVMDLMLGM